MCQWVDTPSVYYASAMYYVLSFLSFHCTLGFLPLSSLSIFIYYLPIFLCYLYLSPCGLGKNEIFFLSSSLHNCLDKSYIDCACRLELISPCTVFSFLLGSSRYDERSSVTIHQSNVLDI